MARCRIVLMALLIIALSLSVACSPRTTAPPTSPPAATPPPATPPVPAPSNPEPEPEPLPETIAIGELPIGSLVRDASWSWEFRNGDNYLDGTTETKPVIWIIAAIDHYEFEKHTPHVTLISAELVARYAFDDSTSRTRSPTPYGSNNWGASGQGDAKFGLRKFLNGAYEDESHPHFEAGFFSALGSEFKSNVLPTELQNVATHDSTGHRLSAPLFYTTVDYVFAPSWTEISGSLQSPYYEVGRPYAYFDMDDPEHGPSDQTSLRGRLDVTITHTNRQRYAIGYWTRQPVNMPDYERNNYTLTVIGTPNNNARDSRNGVRPALNLQATVMVKSQPDRNGVYDIVWGN